MRSANYTYEWLSNFRFGPSGDHQGFSEGRDVVYSHFENFYSAVPTNTYQLKNLTQNSNKSYTINSGAKLKLDVDKGDVVYILWCEKDKKGGGAIKNPITAYFTEES